MDKILEREKRIEREIIQYSKEHIVDKPIDSSDKETNEMLATYLHDNLDIMDEIEMRNIISKCFPIHKLKNKLLEFEFYNMPIVNQEREITLEQFSKEAESILLRYQSKAGGFCLEDNEWIKNTSIDSEYPLRDYEVVYENTIDINDANNLETENYIQQLIDILNSLSTNIDVNVFYLEKKKQKAIMVHLRAQDMNMKSESTVISL